MASKTYDENSFGNDKLDIQHNEDIQVSEFSDDDAIEETSPGKAVWLICMTASMGGFLFGMIPLIYSIVLDPRQV